jgi:hypothetical protein
MTSPFPYSELFDSGSSDFPVERTAPLVGCRTSPEACVITLERADSGKMKKDEKAYFGGAFLGNCHITLKVLHS